MRRRPRVPGGMGDDVLAQWDARDGTLPLPRRREKATAAGASTAAQGQCGPCAATAPTGLHCRPLVRRPGGDRREGGAVHGTDMKPSCGHGHGHGYDHGCGYGWGHGCGGGDCGWATSTTTAMALVATTGHGYSHGGQDQGHAYRHAGSTAATAEATAIAVAAVAAEAMTAAAVADLAETGGG